MKKILFLLIVLFIQVDSFAQKSDLSIEISDLKEEVKKLQLENTKLSSELISSNSKYENRILDLGVKLENLQFEFNVLKRLVEQSRNGGVNTNSTSSGAKGSTAEVISVEKTDSKPKSQSSAQCTATTQKGSRCLRSARSNGLCWQHGG
jgi:hypothetical protein